ncbi:uncharacterized protein LOC120778633 [Bactrocera tryoni]|uniref:uncharacterized protein LOC120778633 n=1 Tax=Bactrocera tryoni TaxID=59916 RepID=UPI001A998983|nr:uncharacterized protein LOC120778633 [Bactrocera tryoni]
MPIYCSLYAHKINSSPRRVHMGQCKVEGDLTSVGFSANRLQIRAVIFGQRVTLAQNANGCGWADRKLKYVYWDVVANADDIANGSGRVEECVVFHHNEDNDPKHTPKIVKEWMLYHISMQLDHLIFTGPQSHRAYIGSRPN